MKNTNIKLKIGALAVIAGLYSTGAVADTANGDADVLVVQPIVLAITATMDFGSVAAGAAVSTLSVAASGAVTNTGGDAVVFDGAGTALQFTIAGENTGTFDLTFVDGVLDDGLGGGAPMAVVITSDDRPATLNGLAQTITVTGDLTVGAGQLAGAYSTTTGGTPILITANYN